MAITKDSTVSIHYTLTVGDQEVDSSKGNAPLTYTHGTGQMIPGLEKALEGQEAGSRVEVDVAPEEGYGQREDDLLVRIPKEAFPEEDRSQISEGVRFQGPHPTKEDQGALYTVVTTDDESVVADANHPLAGQSLHFDVEVVSVQAPGDADQEG